MPGFSGTGPLGQGPLTGRGRGFCVIAAGNNPGVPYGVSGVGNYPVNASYPYQPAYGRSSGYLGFFRGRGAGRAFPRGAGIRGRGRRF